MPRTLDRTRLIPALLVGILCTVLCPLIPGPSASGQSESEVQNARLPLSPADLRPRQVKAIDIPAAARTASEDSAAHAAAGPAPGTEAPAPKRSTVPLRLTPPIATGRIGQMIHIKAEADGPVRWWVDENYCDPGDYTIDSNTHQINLPTPRPGNFFVLAMTVVGDDLKHAEIKVAKCGVTIEGEPQPGPRPNPNPGPGPGPGPNPPQPLDPLAERLKTPYSTDSAAGVGTADDKRNLAAIYRQGAKNEFADVKSTRDVLTAMHSAADSLVGKGRLPQTRQALAQYLQGELGTTTVALDDAIKTKIHAAFAAIATALDRLP